MNFQNIPIKSEEGAKIRSIFIPAPNCTLGVFDYKQIETRIFAHFSEDPVLIDIFKQGRDIHSEMAARAGLDPVKDRNLGKTLVHGITYGSSPYKIKQIADVSEDEAQKIYNKFWDELKVGAAWITRMKMKAYQTGKVTTLMGRDRNFASLRSLRCPHRTTFHCDQCRKRGHIEREVISHIIQGSAADIIKKAMLDCHRTSIDYLMPRLSVHDELHFYIPKDQEFYESSYETIKTIMEQCVDLKVPLEVDGKYCSNWQEAKEK